MKTRFVLLLMVGLVGAMPALAAIEYGEKTYSADLGEVEQVVSSTDINLNIEDVSVSSSVGFLVKFGRWAGEAAKDTDAWLKDKAGIDVVSILKAIGSWFVVVVQWMIDLIKSLLTKL